ncbi:lactococcin 972 family bacteriocin [Glycomyces tenuis]|uniref:lactococcin 972 family bacteriocin n=1 Tax=Glycomyces tenuis TaxID=58116 RepID=UPI00040A9B18|nr:lactococcin 972 family bacteriocin [Glycomyces tenuis]
MTTRIHSLKVRASRAAAVASMAVMMIAGGATAAQAAPAEGDFGYQACSNVGGGTWCQGTQPDGLLKECYSNYKHNSNYHSATAAMAGGTETRYASAGYWARANITAGWAYTCYTYYNPNA